MTEFRRDQVMRRILEAVGREELRRVRFLIGSATLRAAVQLLVDVSQNEARLFIPHYWAEFHHDGRGGFGPRGARKLVFFANPADDPRKPTPRRASQFRHLTADEYQHGLDMNAEARERGDPPFMYVVDAVGPAGGNPFFDRLADGSAARNGPLIARIFDEEMQAAVDEDPDLQGEKRSANVRL